MVISRKSSPFNPLPILLEDQLAPLCKWEGSPFTKADRISDGSNLMLIQDGFAFVFSRRSFWNYSVISLVLLDKISTSPILDTGFHRNFGNCLPS